MTVTNEERHEVAAMLRHVAGHGAPEWATTACCIAECLGEDDYPLWSGTEKLFALLADLIEPEPERTCKRIEKDNPADNECSECGFYLMYMDSYCPNCGARVVE